MSIGGNDTRAQVLGATDIVGLIGQTVGLKRRGKDFVGLCPFHQEKTPSFHVSPARQFFHCYGCKAGGNAIDFVMRRDRIEFKEALTLLADAAGIELPRFGASGGQAGERQMLLEANSAACAFFEKLLSHPQRGAAAREYLDRRGFTADSVRRFQIGLAPDAWDGLLAGDVGRKFRPEILLRAGLVKQRDGGGGFYDTFRNRLIFPIRDEQGRVIAFGGRVMPGSQDPAKYLNSPETPLFSKSRCIYGLDLAKQRAAETRTAVIVEGYTDTVMARQYGVGNVVSVLGTALTAQHVGILRRFVDRIVLLFDPDTAGELAVNRAVELFLTQPVEIAIASIPGGADPDEFLLAQGAAGWEKLIESAGDVLSYKWKQMARAYRSVGDDLTARQKVVEAYLTALAAARGSGAVDPIRWGAVLARVGNLTEISPQELNRRFRRGVSTARKAPVPAPAPAGDGGEPAPEPRPPELWTARDRSERWILGSLLIEPDRWHDVQAQVSVEDFSEPTRRRLAERYWQHQRDEGLPVLTEFLSELADSRLVELAVELVNDVEQLPSRQSLLEDATRHLSDERRRRESRKALSEAAGGEADEIALLKRLQENARTPDLRRA